MKAPLLLVEEARARVLASAKATLGSENVAVGQALGRILSRDVASLRTQPPFANSAMDGYALRAADAAATGAKLDVIGESAAGHAFSGVIGVGECVRIFTGAPMPQGADAIVLQEDTSRSGDAITINAPVNIAAHVRYVGIDFAEGDILLRAGQKLTPRDIEDRKSVV